MTIKLNKDIYENMIINRKSGQKNELLEKERNHFKNILCDEYSIGQQVGISGAKTSCYALTDLQNMDYVLKIPNKHNDTQWVISQKEAIDKRTKFLEGYHGKIVIPVFVRIGDNYIVEPYLGIEFCSCVYDNLSIKDKDKISCEFAKLLSFIHSSSNISVEKKEINFTGEYSLEEIYQYFKDYLAENQRSIIQFKINEYNNRDVSDEYTVMAHRDIRAQNLLYNPDTMKLALIDFERFDYSNVYNDFVPAAPASFDMSYEFLRDVVTKYNQISKLKIDINKVKLFHELGVIHEYGRCAKYRNASQQSIFYAIKKYESLLTKIDKAFEGV